jgi:hypothetical protein
MSIKKQNNPSGWKGKLDELDCLPGETIPDNNASWQKLQGRLQEKKRSRKALWYWAAAVVLPVLMLSFWLISRKENELTAALPVQEQTRKTITEVLPVQDNDTVAAMVVMQNEKKPFVNTNKGIEHEIPGSTVIKEPITGTITDDTTAFVKITPVIIPLAPVDTSVTAVAIQPVKKKLKVVHINELNEPGLPARIAFPGEDYSVLQFRLINQQVYSTASPSVNTINFKIPFSKKISTN